MRTAILPRLDLPAWKAVWSGGRRDALLVLAWALGLRLVFAALTANTYDPDEFVILVLGRDFSHGATPYRDFMFFHPPGALVLFRWLQPIIAWWWPAARVVMLLIDTGTALAVWRIGTLLYGRREALAAGLLYGASPLALICAVRVGQDPIITALGIAGLLLLLSTPSRTGAILAGVCLGLAFWVKYPALLFVPIYALAAPRRARLVFPAALGTMALAFLPFFGEIHPIFNQTVVWQLMHRTPSTLLQRVGAVLAFWILLNPLTVPAILRRRHHTQRHPEGTRGTRRWLLAGFALGAIFVFSSQAYYHYFLPIVPFAVLLAAPLAVGLVKRSPRVVAVATVSLVLIWAADITFGSDPSRLFITASQFSAIQPTVALLERTTEPGTRVLADEFEYAFLARRPSMADYFWNMDTVISARYLEYHLSRTGAVILTRLVTQPYPAGFTRYLREGGFIHIHTAATEIWLPRHAVAEKLRDQVASLQSLVVSRESGSSITEPQIDRARTND